MSLPIEINIDGARYRRVGPDRVSTHVMFDSHLFDQLKARSPDDIVAEWVRLNSDAEYTKDYGKCYLCPVIVLDGDKEIRRVGRMVFPESDDCDKKLGEWLREVKADPDITRILAERPTVSEESAP